MIKEVNIGEALLADIAAPRPVECSDAFRRRGDRFDSFDRFPGKPMTAVIAPHHCRFLQDRAVYGIPLLLTCAPLAFLAFTMDTGDKSLHSLIVVDHRGVFGDVLKDVEAGFPLLRRDFPFLWVRHFTIF
jgi:hypothetical protein